MLNYRKELDGLRAIAVLAVMAYHANLQVFGIEIFKGGFFGVDVFFVLSGYLIGKIVIKDSFNGFSLLNYYIRRVKRIVPVLYFVLFTSLIVGYFVLDESNFVELKNSTISSMFFYANEYFMDKDGYFANNERNMLLHTWTLGVEWQFYFAFPFVFLLISKMCKSNAYSFVVVLLCMSFMSSYGFYLIGEQKFAFFSLFTRSWELLAGVVIAFVDRESILSKSRLRNDFLSVLSLFLILFSMFFIDSNKASLTLYTMIPVLGTCGVILFTNKDELIGKIISLKPFVLLGLMSYSIYLWHQPVFVIFRYLKHDYIRLEQFVLLFFIISIMSFLSYHFVENKFRKRSGNFVLASFLLVVGLSTFFISKNLKQPEIIPEEARVFAGYFVSQNGKTCHSLITTGEYCYFKSDSKLKERVIVTLGDSHNGMYAKAVREFTENNQYSWIDLSAGGSYPFDNFWPKSEPLYDHYTSTVAHIQSALRGVLSNFDDVTVIYSQYMDGQLHFLETDNVTLNEKMKKIGEDLQNLQSKVNRLVLIYQHPVMKENVLDLVQRDISKSLTVLERKEYYESSEVKIAYSDFQSESKESYQVLDSVEGDNVIRIYPEDVLCDKSYCYGKMKYKDMDMYDTTHLSPLGADQVFKLISAKLGLKGDN